jgi:hypothetical protein
LRQGGLKLQPERVHLRPSTAKMRLGEVDLRLFSRREAQIDVTQRQIAVDECSGGVPDRWAGRFCGSADRPGKRKGFESCRMM